MSFVWTAHCIAGFSLEGHFNSLEWMGVSENDVIVFSTGPCLVLFNLWGFRLQIFQDYPELIVRLKVVCLRCFPSGGFLKMDLQFKLILLWGAHVLLCLCEHTEARVQRTALWSSPSTFLGAPGYAPGLLSNASILWAVPLSLFLCFDLTLTPVHSHVGVHWRTPSMSSSHLMMVLWRCTRGRREIPSLGSVIVFNTRDSWDHKGKLCFVI